MRRNTSIKQQGLNLIPSGSTMIMRCKASFFLHNAVTSDVLLDCESKAVFTLVRRKKDHTVRISWNLDTALSTSRSNVTKCRSHTKRHFIGTGGPEFMETPIWLMEYFISIALDTWNILPIYTACCTVNPLNVLGLQHSCPVQHLVVPSVPSSRRTSLMRHAIFRPIFKTYYTTLYSWLVFDGQRPPSLVKKWADTNWTSSPSWFWANDRKRHKIALHPTVQSNDLNRTEPRYVLLMTCWQRH